MSYKALAKTCLAISILCIFLAVALENPSFWGGFFAFLFFGILLNSLHEKDEEIEGLRPKSESEEQK